MWMLCSMDVLFDFTLRQQNMNNTTLYFFRFPFTWCFGNFCENQALLEGREKLLHSNEQLHQQLSDASKASQCFGYEKLKENDNQYYTGFSMERFSHVYTFLVPSEEKDPVKWSKSVKSARKLCSRDQLLLVLIKLRQNFDFKHCSFVWKFFTRLQCNILILDKLPVYVFFALVA